MQSEQVKKVDPERQMAAEKAKQDFETTVASNAKAISDLKNDMDQTIVDKFKPVVDKLNSTDGDIDGLRNTLAKYEDVID